MVRLHPPSLPRRRPGHPRPPPGILSGPLDPQGHPKVAVRREVGCLLEGVGRPPPRTPLRLLRLQLRRHHHHPQRCNVGGQHPPEGDLRTPPSADPSGPPVLPSQGACTVGVRETLERQAVEVENPPEDSHHHRSRRHPGWWPHPPRGRRGHHRWHCLEAHRPPTLR